jgi:3-oxoadipate enol-lactonase
MSRLPGSTGILVWSDTNPGGDPTTLLIHSLGTDSRIWESQVGWLAASGRRVVAIDLPGHGESTANRGPYSIDALGSDIAAIMDTVTGAGPFEVMGVSLGGLLAIWLAVSSPERVSALIPCNTAARLGSAEGWEERIGAVATGGMESIRESVVARFFSPEFPARHPDVFSRASRAFVDTDPDGYMGCCAALRDADLSDRVSRIVCPTLLVAGEVDVATPPEVSEWLHERIPESRIAVIAGAGHISNLDRPEEFDRVVGDFLLSL